MKAASRSASTVWCPTAGILFAAGGAERGPTIQWSGGLFNLLSLCSDEESVLLNSPSLLVTGTVLLFVERVIRSGGLSFTDPRGVRARRWSASGEMRKIIITRRFCKKEGTLMSHFVQSNANVSLSARLPLPRRGLVFSNSRRKTRPSGRHSEPRAHTEQNRGAVCCCAR